MNDLFREWRQPTAEEQQALQDLAKQYHDRCDVYDRTVCSGRSPRTDEPMPVDGYELALVNKNARAVHADVVRQGAAMGLTEAQITKAIQEYADRETINV
jgi:hypothetical protein